MTHQPKFPRLIKFWKYEIERIGRRLGLRFTPTIYEVVNSEQMSEVVAYDGYPIRYHHWSFGQESLKMKKLSTRFGLITFYELIIPTSPCYAYLLDTNDLGIQKSVMAHAGLGHNDFFENNCWFGFAPKNMHTTFAAHADRMDELRREVGKDDVDVFLEACISLSNMIDVLGPVVRRLPDRTRDSDEKDVPKEPVRVPRKEGVPAYMDRFINPPEWIDEQKKKIEQDAKRERDIARGMVIPEAPVRDVLGFLLEYASLEPWQREVLDIVREESYGLWMGAQTKIMNEGWAAYWERTVMVGEGVVLDSETCSFARSYAGVLRGSPHNINPYRLGNELWEDICYRWDTGRHGDIYEDCKEGSIITRWDEFAIFKKLFERNGGMTESFHDAWAEFCTLVQETIDGRGPTHGSFFNSRNYVLEWLALEQAEDRLKEFMRLREKVRYVEEEILAELRARNLPSDSPERFKIHFEITKRNNYDSDLDWSMEELEMEIAYAEKLLAFRAKFQAALHGESHDDAMTVVRKPILEQWIAWARTHPDPLLLGAGRQRMFEIRETYNDVMFIQDFFTPDFCVDKGYFTIAVTEKYNPNTGENEDYYVVRSRECERVKIQLIAMFRNIGQPMIEIIDANFNNNRELLLRHVHDGRDLDPKDIPRILKRLWQVWGHKKTVYFETIETEYPERKPWWFYWRPIGAPPRPKEKITRTAVRYRFDGNTKKLDKVVL